MTYEYQGLPVKTIVINVVAYDGLKSLYPLVANLSDDDSNKAVIAMSEADYAKYVADMEAEMPNATYNLRSNVDKEVL